MKVFKLYVGKKEISNFASGVNWSSDIDTLSAQLGFTVKNNQSPELGARIVFVNGGKTVFIGVVTAINRQKQTSSITANDYAWYLNKNKAFQQFKNISITDAIEQLCGKYKIPVGEIALMPRKVTKLYTDVYVNEIFKALIEEHERETGQTMHLEMRGGKLYVFPVAEQLIDPVFELSGHLGKFHCFDFISNDFSETLSIEDMVNHVQVIQNNRILSDIKNPDAIKKYGMLSETVTVDGTNVAQAKNDAKTLIESKSIVPTEMSVNVMGSDEILAGRTVRWGGFKWLIKSANHTYGGTHKCAVTLKKGTVNDI